MGELSDSDLRFCQELVYTPAGLLTVTHRFWPPEQQVKLLALHALFGSIRSIPFTVSDPGISSTKLAWWHQELEPSRQRVSQHPVVKACRATGVFEFFDPTRVHGYLAAWASLAPGEPIQSLASMRETILNIGAIEATLEVNLLAGENKPVLLENLGAALSLSFFMDRFDSKLSGESWWVPLELQARYGVTFSSLKNPQHRDGLRGVIEAVGGFGLDLCGLARRELNTHRQKNVNIKAIRHLEACLDIAERRIKKRMESPQATMLRKPSFAEILIAWRSALR